MSDSVRRRFVFHGRVQGVGFRAFCLDAAVARGMRGWVRNRPDGTVELEAEGAPSDLEELVHHLEKGNPFARVDSVDDMGITARGDEAEGFDIIH